MGYNPMYARLDRDLGAVSDRRRTLRVIHERAQHWTAVIAGVKQDKDRDTAEARVDELMQLRDLLMASEPTWEPSPAREAGP